MQENNFDKDRKLFNCKNLGFEISGVVTGNCNLPFIHGGEFGERIDSVKDGSFARGGAAGAIARCLRRAFFRTPYDSESASPIMPAVD